MCGLLAIHSARKQKLFQSDVNEFKHMLLITSLRGPHSTGIAGMDLGSDNEVAIVKAVDSPYYMNTFKQTEEFYDNMEQKYSTVIGHSRYATHGKISATNAHPFKEGKIILAHNGIINNFKELKEKYNHKDLDVDSHLIARLFNEVSPEEIITQIQGSYAFMWFNTENKTFNVARNLARPLYVGTYANSEVLIFSSEKETLSWNAERNKTPLSSNISVEPHKIYSYSEDSIIPTITEYKPYVPAAHKRTQTYEDDHYSFYGSSRSAVVSKPQALTLTLHSTITYSIIDYTIGKYQTHVEGYNEDNPKVLFRSLYNYKVDEVIFDDHEYLVGEIVAITKNPAEQNFEYTCYVKPKKLLRHVEIPKKDTGEVVLMTSLRNSITITTLKVKAALKKPCAWCNTLHREGTINRTSEILWDEYDEKIVCPDCANLLYGHWEEQDRKVETNKVLN